MLQQKIFLETKTNQRLYIYINIYNPIKIKKLKFLQPFNKIFFPNYLNSRSGILLILFWIFPQFENDEEEDENQTPLNVLMENENSSVEPT